MVNEYDLSTIMRPYTLIMSKKGSWALDLASRRNGIVSLNPQVSSSYYNLFSLVSKTWNDINK